jgi:hypothetical protein
VTDEGTGHRLVNLFIDLSTCQLDIQSSITSTNNISSGSEDIAAVLCWARRMWLL